MADIILYDENKNGHTGADAINNLYSNAPDSPDKNILTLENINNKLISTMNAMQYSYTAVNSALDWNEAKDGITYGFNALKSYFDNIGYIITALKNNMTNFYN